MEDLGLPALNSDDEDLLAEAADIASNEIAFCSEIRSETEISSHGDSSLSGENSLRTSLGVFKHGRYGLSVTDLVNQYWCEQQFEYSYTKPIVKAVPEIVASGSAIHLERELEVHDIIPVTCETEEDAWALKLLNCYQQLSLLSQQITIREFAVFGDLFDKGLFIQGVIDEIRCNTRGLLEIHELKTRSRKTLPNDAQQNKNALQVAIYEELLESMLFKRNSLAAVKSHVSLEWNSVLNDDIIHYSKELGIPCSTFQEVGNAFENFLEAFSFPALAPSVVEYCFQEDKQTIGCCIAGYSKDSLNATISKQYEFLFGTRQPIGVDIEDAWKCAKCDYFDICIWRKKQESKCRNHNALNFKT